MTVRGNITNAVVGNRVLDADNFGNRLYFASYNTKEFMLSIAESVKQLFTGKVSSAELVGPVGISEVVAKTNGFREFIYILAAYINITWRNKLIAISTTRWRKNCANTIGSNSQKTIKTRNRNKNTVGRFCGTHGGVDCGDIS